MPLLPHDVTFDRVVWCPHRVVLATGNSTEDAKRWCNANTKGDCYQSGWYRHSFFRFQLRDDALMFKLTYG